MHQDSFEPAAIQFTLERLQESFINPAIANFLME